MCLRLRVPAHMLAAWRGQIATICGGSGWKVVERTTAGAQALSSDNPAHRSAIRKWCGPCPVIAPLATGRTACWLRARVPERYRHCDFDNFETDNENDGGEPRTDRGLEPQPGARLSSSVQRFAENFSGSRNANGTRVCC